MTVEVTKIVNEKLAGALKFSKLLENLDNQEVIFKSLPELYLEDLKNQSIAFDFIKKALSYEVDDKLKLQVETTLLDVLLQKMSEKEINQENLSLIFNKAYTHWSNVMLIVHYGTVTLFTYSVISRSMYLFDLDETVRGYDLKLLAHTEELNSIQDRNTPHFRAKKLKLQDSIDNLNLKKDFVVSNRELLDTLQVKFQEIFAELKS